MAWVCGPTPEMAEALYVGLITDTGRFMYENTGPRAHEMAADLIEAGVDVQAVYRGLYEEMPEGKLALLALALDQVRRFDSGELDACGAECRGLPRRPTPRRATRRASSTICGR